MIPAAGSRPGESLPEQWKECKSTARAANRMEESGRSDAPRYPIWGFDTISTFRSMERYICHRSV